MFYLNFHPEMRDFATQSFNEYKIDLTLRTVDKEFDYRLIVSNS